MPRNSEYQEFLDVIGGRKKIDPDEDTEASLKDIGWWKKEQVRKALHHARYQIATPEELELLKRCKVPIPNNAHKRTRQEIKRQS